MLGIVDGTEEKSQKDQVVATSMPSKPLLILYNCYESTPLNPLSYQNSSKAKYWKPADDTWIPNSCPSAIQIRLFRVRGNYLHNF